VGLSFVFFSELPGGHCDCFLEDSCEIALVVVSHFEADYRAAFFGGEQQSLCVADAYAREVIDGGDSRLFFEEVCESRYAEEGGFCNVGKGERPVVVDVDEVDGGSDLGHLDGVLGGVDAFDEVVEGATDPGADVLLVINVDDLIDVVDVFFEHELDIDSALDGGAAEDAEQFDEAGLEDVDIAGVLEHDGSEDGIEHLPGAGSVADLDFSDELSFGFVGIACLGAVPFALLNVLADFGLLSGPLTPPCNDTRIEVGSFVQEYKEELGSLVNLSAGDDRQGSCSVEELVCADAQAREVFADVGDDFVGEILPEAFAEEEAARGNVFVHDRDADVDDACVAEGGIGLPRLECEVEASDAVLAASFCSRRRSQYQFAELRAAIVGAHFADSCSVGPYHFHAHAEMPAKTLLDSRKNPLCDDIRQFDRRCHFYAQFN